MENRTCGTCAYQDFINCIKPRKFGWYCDNKNSESYKEFVDDRHSCEHWAAERAIEEPECYLEYDERYNILRGRPRIRKEIPDGRTALEQLRKQKQAAEQNI